MVSWDKPSPITCAEDAHDFLCLFDVADEVYPRDGGLTLADLDPQYVDVARKAAERLDLSWPPYLPECEEYMLAHGQSIRFHTEVTP